MTDGAKVQGNLGVIGWVLTNKSVGKVKIYADIMSGNNTVKSIELDYKEMGAGALEKRQKKNVAEIAAEKGYEIKGSYSVEDVPEGTYDLNLRVSENGKDKILQTIKINIAGARKTGGDVMDFMGAASGTQVLSNHYIYEEKGFAIGLDAEESMTANANQILFTGWFNAAKEKGFAIGAIVKIDSQDYTNNELVAMGGSMTITRAPRNLDLMDSALIGNFVGDTSEAGYIIQLNLPFLNAGEHVIEVAVTVGSDSVEKTFVDMKPINVTVTPSAGTDEKAVERITSSWEKEFPQPTAVPDLTPVPEAETQQ